MPTWNPKLTIGLPAIDAQHRELADRADRLLAALHGGRADAEVDRLFWYVDDYATCHFAAEEALMRDAGFPDAKLHGDLHQAFTAEFEALVERFRDEGRSAELLRDLEQLFGELLVEHVRTHDARLAAFVNARAAPLAPHAQNSFATFTAKNP